MVGLNCTFNVTAEPEFNVTGKAAPGIVKPVPVRAAALMVTGVVPVDVRVNDCDVVVLTVTLPKGMLPGLMLSVAMAGFNCRTNTLEMPLAFPITLAVCVELTEATVVVNPVWDAPAATVTEAGTLTVGLSLDRVTTTLVVVGLVRYTEHAFVPAPVIEVLPQETALRVGVVAADREGRKRAKQHSTTKRTMGRRLNRKTWT